MNCPKCGAHIGRFELRPNCRECGVNLMYYTQEKALIHDAKLAELEYAGARIFIAKLKAAFLDGSLQIVRMVLTFLCICALAIPLGGVTISLPLFEQKISVGAVGVYSLISDGLFAAVTDLAAVDAFSPFMTRMLVCLGVFAVLTLLTLAVFLLELLSFISIKKTAKHLCICSTASIILCAASALTMLLVKSSAQPFSYVSVQTGIGALALAAVYGALLTVNLLIYKKDIPVRCKENDLLRRDTLKRVKRGEINIDDLPLPVFETEAERRERLDSLREAEEMQDAGGVFVE